MKHMVVVVRPTKHSKDTDELQRYLDRGWYVERVDVQHVACSNANTYQDPTVTFGALVYILRNEP